MDKMNDVLAWKAIHKLLLTLQYQPVGHEEENGFQKYACPICYKNKGHEHTVDCELGNAIKTIESLTK